MSSLSTKLIKEGADAWKILNGIFTVYKPPGISFAQASKTLILNLQRDLNELQREPRFKHIQIEGATNAKMEVVVRDSYADHPLVAGPQYVYEDFKLVAANRLGREASGVLVCGVNHGNKLIIDMKKSKLTKFYKLKGILGQARVDNFATGKILEKSTWKRIKRGHIDSVCAALQGVHQRKMFETSGVNIQSQEAFELACKGPLRAGDKQIPVIYTIKCIDFKPPEFTLEIVCINDYEDYLKALIAEIGFKLHSTAHCSYIQCTQYGLFNVKDALLSKYWDLENIFNNMALCRKTLLENSYMLEQEHANLVPNPSLKQSSI